MEMSSSMPSSSRRLAASSRISACGDGDAAMERVPPSSSFSAVSPLSSPSEPPPPQAASTAANTDMVSSNKNFSLRQNLLLYWFLFEDYPLSTLLKRNLLPFVLLKPILSILL